MAAKENCCQHCLKPLEDCIKLEEIYIRQLRSEIHYKWKKIPSTKLSRHERAVYRLLGLYSMEKDIYYDLPDIINWREYDEKMASLPLCLFDKIHEYEFYRSKLWVTESNIYDLEIEKDYKRFLSQLFDNYLDYNFLF